MDKNLGKSKIYFVGCDEKYLEDQNLTAGDLRVIKQLKYLENGSFFDIKNFNHSFSMSDKVYQKCLANLEQWGYLVKDWTWSTEPDYLFSI